VGFLDFIPRDAPTIADMRRQRTATPKSEMKTRLKEKTEKRTDESKAEREWRKVIWKRDEGKCRWCKRKVAKTIELIPERGECHHVVGRANQATRWEPRNGILVCASCHERLTGKVNEKHVLVAAKTYTLDGVQYPDASKAVQFKRVV
jgi:hypothetical protein